MVALLWQCLYHQQGNFKKAQKIIKKQTKKSGHFLPGSETLIFYSENFYCLIIS
jgi:hypothetical protein